MKINKENKLPVFYSLIEKIKREDNTSKLTSELSFENIKKYKTELSICLSPEKPISKLLKE